MKNKPDDRRDNVDRIQQNISNTIENIHLANEMIEETSDENTKETLIEKNRRREKALDSMRSEIKDEAMAKENGYK
ncbi:MULTISPECIES: small acid-soluble spore protein Tlp [Clostridium]|uniref:Protein Tlp homolog n=1 Tax=Clostridium faecium TaxID=2762223 RepID=A0ABR8YSF6_9CLOT|nr:MULTISPECIES: small acid-soluble spore protein Tlp [Clostridium]MBD8047190.1 small acid-soluble spore protein Tlp [Clostridium faecium]MDU1348428.1 small acid-soluble spore protein Tlp [Clostridium argentinense]